MPTPKPYGSWKSPITSELLVQKLLKFSEVRVTKDHVFWLEMRPSEKGRTVVCSLPLSSTNHEDIKSWTIPEHNARTRVHEYGGGSYIVSEDNQVFYSNFADQHVYKQKSPSGAPELLVAADSKWRYADYDYDPKNNVLYCVGELHKDGDHSTEPLNCILSLNLNSLPCTPKIIVEGADFYSNPKISPNGKHLCWVQWNHPNMPWDSSFLCVGELTNNGCDIAPSSIVTVDGGPEISIASPRWSPKNELTYVSDATDWWNLYQLPANSLDGKSKKALCPKNAEFTDSGDFWNFGGSSFCFDSTGDNMLVRFVEGAGALLHKLELSTGKLTPINTGFFGHSQVRWASNGAAYMLGSSPNKSTALICVNLSNSIGDKSDAKIIQNQQTLSIDPNYFSIPEVISFPTTNNLTAYANLYLPANPDFVGLENELPPLLVKIHGGPTAQASTAFNMLYQYWTSRGFAILDVNYGGSMGYGRKYRNRLIKSWGIVDVDDACNAATYVANTLKKADINRLAIDGGSAGGFTVLAALTFRNVFKAGCSNYGVADLSALATDTHKFEARYLDNLIGKYPEEESVYKERSPIEHVDKLNCPIIIFQGDEDNIVPPNQSEMMFQAAKKKGIPVTYILFKGEQHGFRNADNIRRQIDGEFYFFSKIFGFQPADETAPVEIHNFKSS